MIPTIDLPQIKKLLLARNIMAHFDNEESKRLKEKKRILQERAKEREKYDRMRESSGSTSNSDDRRKSSGRGKSLGINFFMNKCFLTGPFDRSFLFCSHSRICMF